MRNRVSGFPSLCKQKITKWTKEKKNKHLKGESVMIYLHFFKQVIVHM